MKKTFITTMPDQVGAFLLASRIMSSLMLNITRVSYNKALDNHTMFIEAEGEQESLEQAEALLSEHGYMQSSAKAGNVILIEFKLYDEPGSVVPILELIGEYEFNISYISSQQNGTSYQYFKMGLFVESSAVISDFLRSVSELCEIKFIDYDPSGKVLDNTVFYISFANEIAEKLSLCEEEKAKLMIESNLIMQMLEQKNEPPHKTFEYIGKFAEMLYRYRRESFNPRISRFNIGSLRALLIEPPCGSNIIVIDAGESLLFVDSGFACYREEMLSLLRTEYKDFDIKHKVLIISHADIDHCGITDIFDEVYLSGECYKNFADEAVGRPNTREQNLLHAPYVRISKILSCYKTPCINNLVELGGGAGTSFSFGELNFEVYKGNGGHAPGEIVLIEHEKHVVFTGDIWLNLSGFTPEQASFNKIAPYLMTSVDTDKEAAAAERKRLMKYLGEGEWLLIGGHGAPLKIKI